MKSHRLARYISAVFVIAAFLTGFAGTVQAGDANLHVQFTTTNCGGTYAPGHVHVVWIKSSTGTFVATVGTNVGTTRALWGNSQATRLIDWYSNNPQAGTDVSARTGATQSTFTTYTIDWNWRKTDGTIVPDGNYQIFFMLTSSNSGTPSNTTSFSITKGSTSWSTGPTTQGGYNNVSISFTPASLGVSALAATNATSTTATLNGSVDATDGVNPAVTLYWGTTDGGTTPTAWANTVNMGTLGVGTFSANVTNLNPLTTYYYRCRAVTTTPAKDVWSSTAASFTTQTTTFAQMDVSPAVISFNQVQPNNSRDLSVIVRNLGQSALSINSLKFIGLESDAYSLVSPPAMPLTLNAVQPPVTANWTGRNISASPTGSYTANGSTITVNGSGADIWGADDAFYFVYQTLSGNGQIVARVDSIQNTNAWAKAGVMMRSGTSSDGLNAFMAVTPGNGVTFQWRAISEDDEPSYSVSTPGYSAPYWVKLVRSGNTFSGYRSPDGVTWTQQGTSQTISMGTTVNIGLAVTSHLSGTLCTAVFSNISGNIQMATPEIIDQRTLTVRFSPKSVQDYNYAKLAIGSNDPGKIDYVTLAGIGGPDAALGTRQVGGIGGNARALARYGTKVLMGQGAMLVLLDVSNPAAPSKIDQIRLDGVIEAITVSGDTAYAALGNKGFAVVNLKDFKPLRGATTIETGGFASDIDTDGTYLCIADGIAGTHVYNIASPLNPVSVKTYTTTGAVEALDIAGGLLYVLDESLGVQVFQFSSNTPLKSYDIKFGTQMAVSGNLLYVVDALGNLSILNTLGAITLQSETRLQAGFAKDIQVLNGKAYIAEESEQGVIYRGISGIEVLDVSNPASPTQVSVYASAAPKDLLLDNTTACVADASSGLNILDISIPTAIASLGSYSMRAASGGVGSPASLEDVYVVGSGQNLTNYDLSSSANPVSKDVYGALAFAEDVAIQGQYAYVAAGLSGLQVFDLSNPAATPGSFATAAYASAVSVNGTKAMVSDGQTVYVLNISSPMAPSLVGSWQANGHVFDVTAGTTHGYAAKGGMGISVISLSDAQPTGSYQTNGVAYGVTVDSNTLYVACGTAGLAILNVTNPASPALIANYDMPGVIGDVAKIGNRLCAADITSGVSILDVTNPATPAMYANSATSTPAYRISSAGSRILVADRQGGLAVLGVTGWPKAGITADLSDDGLVDLDDLLILTGQWLDEETVLNSIAANLDYYDTIVGMGDLAVIAADWLKSDSALSFEGYWKFDEATGSIASDTSLNSYDGVLMNMDNSDWVGGIKGNALDFDGTNDYVEISGYKGITGTASRTCSAWIKTSGSTSNTVIVDWGTASADQKWLFGVFSTGELAVYTWPSYIKTNRTVTDNQWHHVAAVLADDGTPNVNEIKLYVDGQLQVTTASSAQAINTVAAANVVIGAYDAGAKSGYFKGLIDDVRIYNQALTLDEILATAPGEIGLAAEWKLDEYAGTIAKDALGSHNGTLRNTTGAWVAGKTGNALTFDGMDDYVEITGYKGITGTASRTCSAWIKTSGSTANMVIMDWGTAVSGQKWLFGIFTTGQLALYTWTPYIQTTISVTDNQWHHVAVVLADDGTPNVSEIKLYVDGLLQATTVSLSQAINTVSATDVLLGACDYAGTKGFYFNGLMDEVRIYNRALADAEITLLAE
jgi:hypothetical protein